MTMVVPLGWQVLDANGDPYSGAKAYFYETGTATPQDTYSESTLTTPNANPLVADAAGRFGPAYGPTTTDYKVVLKTSADVTIATYDPVQMTSAVGELSVDTAQLVADAVTNAKLDNMATLTIKGRLTSGTGDPEDLTPGQAASVIGSLHGPGHRLSLTTALAVTTADVTAAASIFWTPDKHNIAPMYDGSYWRNKAVAQLSLALDSDSGHTGYHQSGFNFDVWLDYNAGTPRIGTGSAWTNDTTQADVVSRDATYGHWVNNGTVTLRFGTGAGDTASKGAGTLLWLGTIRCTANGQTEDSFAKRFVWNVYNRHPRDMKVVDATNSWTYTTATDRQANGSTANQLAAVFGLAEDPVEITVVSTSVNSSASIYRRVGVGVDSTSVDSKTLNGGPSSSMDAGTHALIVTEYRGFAAVGYHFYAWLEFSTATGTATWFGDNGGGIQSGIVGRVWA